MRLPRYTGAPLSAPGRGGARCGAIGAWRSWESSCCWRRVPRRPRRRRRPRRPRPHRRRSALLLPEVRDESAWFGGFPGAFLDSEKEYVFSFQAESTPQAYVNRDVIPESELSTIQQLADPKWKGKIAFHDPRVDGAGNGR